MNLIDFKKKGEKIACLTAYDASIAKLLDDCGIDVILVGDSLGMVVKGFENTRSVKIPDMIYHTKAVSGVCKKALVMTDMPYKTYLDEDMALMNAKKLISAGAQMVKLEGGEEIKHIIKFLVDNHIPVCAHLGLQPQKFKDIKDYKIQGINKESSESIINDALLVESLGVKALVLECIPKDLAKKISNKLTIPTIGIGAGKYCDGQILVCFDMLGISECKNLKFVRNFAKYSKDIHFAIDDFINSVKNISFPDDSESY